MTSDNNNNKSKVKVIFHPQFLEELRDTMSPDEADQLLQEIQQLADSGELFSQSTVVDMDDLTDTDPELAEIIQERLDDSTPTLH